MRYDGRTLIARNQLPVSRVWDDSSGSHELRDGTRWICEDTAGNLWIYIPDECYWFKMSSYSWCHRIRDTIQPSWVFGKYSEDVGSSGGSENPDEPDDNVKKYVVMIKDVLKNG
jgi:hypothetical protein